MILHTLPLLQRKQPFMNFSSVSASTGWSYSWTIPARVSSIGCSPSGRISSSMGPLPGHKSCQNTWSSVGSSLHGFTGPSWSLLLPTWSFHGITGIFEHLPDPVRGPSLAADASLLHHKPLWTVSWQPWSSSEVDLKKLVVWRNSWGLEKGKYCTHL